MPRANKHFIPGYVWHITHPCHKQEFLLKFSRDRKRWLHGLYEAKKRFGLCVQIEFGMRSRDEIPKISNGARNF